MLYLGLTFCFVFMYGSTKVTLLCLIVVAIPIAKTDNTIMQRGYPHHRGAVMHMHHYCNFTNSMNALILSDLLCEDSIAVRAEFSKALLSLRSIVHTKYNLTKVTTKVYLLN